MEFTLEELELLRRMIEVYWNEYNSEHEDNLEDWRTTFNIVKKLT